MSKFEFGDISTKQGMKHQNLESSYFKFFAFYILCVSKPTSFSAGILCLGDKRSETVRVVGGYHKRCGGRR